MWLIFINCKQQIHRAFNFLISNVDRKKQLIFITKHNNANAIFCLNLSKIFFSHRKPNAIVIKIIKKFFLSSRVILSGCILTGLICLTKHHKKHFDHYSWCLLAFFWNFSIQQVMLCKKFLLMVFKLKR